MAANGLDINNPKNPERFFLLKLNSYTINGTDYIAPSAAYESARLTRSFNIAPDGSYIKSGSIPRDASSSFGYVEKLISDSTLPTGSFALTVPSYDCNTGALTLTTTGGNGAPIDFRIVGLRDWASSNSFSVPAHQRANTTFTLEARQNGQVITLPFTTACGTTTPPVTPPVPPPTGSFALTAPSYDCNTGALTINSTTGNGTPIDYRIVGLRDWAPSNSFTVPAWQRTDTRFTLEARQSGEIISLAFTTACGITTPQPPVTPPTGTALDFGSPGFDCQTGRLVVGVNGGDGGIIEFRVPGLADWQRSAIFTVPTYQRNGTTFTLYARQSGREISTSFTTGCGTARLANVETDMRWQVSVLGNPVEEQVQLRLSGLTGQAVGLSVVDATGRVIAERQVVVGQEGQQESLRLESTGGVYVLRAISQGQQQVIKLIK